MTMEAGVLLDLHLNPVYWHAPEDRTMGSLPDSRKLWDEIWTRKGGVAAFAHTHPGSGLTGPSGTDLTTFDAIEKALGRSLIWLIATSDRVVRCRRVRVDSTVAPPRMVWLTEEELALPNPSAWLPRLRELSYGDKNNG